MCIQKCIVFKLCIKMIQLNTRWYIYNVFKCKYLNTFKSTSSHFICFCQWETNLLYIPCQPLFYFRIKQNRINVRQKKLWGLEMTRSEDYTETLPISLNFTPSASFIVYVVPQSAKVQSMPYKCVDMCLSNICAHCLSL